MSPTENDRQPLRIEQSNGTTIVHFQSTAIYWSFPEYDDADVLKEKLKYLIGQGHIDLVLELSTVEFVSSMFLGILMLLERRLKQLGGRLRLCSLQPDVEQILHVCGLHRYFEIYPDPPTALASRRP